MNAETSLLLSFQTARFTSSSGHTYQVISSSASSASSLKPHVPVGAAFLSIVHHDAPDQIAAAFTG